MNADGLEMKEPFLDLPLPSRDEKSVTILFHPGRVKSVSGANLTLGRALVAGTTVTLVVNHPALAKPVCKSVARRGSFDVANRRIRPMVHSRRQRREAGPPSLSAWTSQSVRPLSI